MVNQTPDERFINRVRAWPRDPPIEKRTNFARVRFHEVNPA